MNRLRMLLIAPALLLIAGPAAAVTVKNTSKSDVTIGIDWGSKEKVETVPAGKEVKFDCPDGCGVSGPWAFSWKAKGDDTFTTDGTNMITPKQ